MGRFRDSRFGSIFTRKRPSIQHAPDDLYVSKQLVKGSSTDCFETDSSDEVTLTESTARLGVSEFPAKEDDLKSAITWDILQVKDVLQVDFRELQKDVTIVETTQQYGPEEGIEKSFDTNEQVRNVHADMLEAITQALSRNKQSKLGASIISDVPPTNDLVAPDAQDLELNFPEDFLKPDGAEANASGNVIKAQSARIADTLRLAHNRLQRRRTANDVLDISDPQSESASHQRTMLDYSSKPLPCIPMMVGTSSPDSPIARKHRISRKAMRRANCFYDWPELLPKAGSRHRSGSVPLLPTSSHPDSSSSPAAAMAEVRPTNSHLLGLLLFWHWISDGRRFFDQQTVDKLSVPGSRCLTIEHSVIGFQTTFPLASVTTYRSSSAAETSSKGARYTNLPYPDNHFDVVNALALTVSVTSSHWHATLQELKRVLKPGGHLEIHAFSAAWINGGPTMRRLAKQYAKGLQKDGFDREIMQTLPHHVKAAGFEQIKLAYLAVPAGWGGRVSNVFGKYYEPVRAFRERRTRCHWTPEQLAKVSEEQIAYRSSRGLLLIVAVK